MSTETHLLVPGAWLAACGLGTEDRVFPVLCVERGFIGRHPATFVTVERDGYPWTVHMEWRNARFVPAPSASPGKLVVDWHLPTAIGAAAVATVILTNLDRAGGSGMLEPEEADRIYDSIVGPPAATPGKLNEAMRFVTLPVDADWCMAVEKFGAKQIRGAVYQFSDGSCITFTPSGGAVEVLP